MGNMVIFISILFIVFGILQIILFFKLWGMTNDIRAMKKHTVDPGADILRKALLKGDKDQAKEILINQLCDDLICFKNGDNTYGSIYQILASYKEIFDKIGIEMPSSIKKLNTADDIINLI